MNDIFSASLYLLVAIVSVLLLWFSVKQSQKVWKIILIILALIIPIIVAGLRYNVGIDYPEYVRIFENIIAGQFNNIQTIEPSYILLSYLSEAIFNAPTLLFISYSAVFIVFSYFTIKKLIPERLPLVMFLLLTTVYPISLNVMRQMAAAAIICFAITFIVNKTQKIKFFGLTAFGVLIHFSAVFGLLFYPIVKLIAKLRENKKTITIILLFIGLFGVSLLLPFILQGLAQVPIIERYTHLIADGSIEFHFSPRLIVDLVIIILIWLLFGSQFKKSKTKFIILALLTFGAVIKASGTFTLYGSGGRFSLYTIIFLPIILGYITKMPITKRLPEKIREFWGKPKVSTTIVIVFAICYFIGICVFDSVGYGVLPYQSILW